MVGCYHFGVSTWVFCEYHFLSLIHYSQLAEISEKCFFFVIFL